MYLPIIRPVEHWRENSEVKLAVDQAESETGYVSESYAEYDCWTAQLVQAVIDALREQGHQVQYIFHQSERPGELLALWKIPQNDREEATQIVAGVLERHIKTFRCECVAYAEVELEHLRDQEDDY